MASPVVTVTVNPPSLPAGGGVSQVKINAHDPDVGAPGKEFAFTAEAESSDGEVMQVVGSIFRDALPGDTITGYALLCDEPGVVIVQDPNDPSLFTVTVPGV